MQAILMYGSDLFMGSIVIDRLEPMVRLPISKALTGLTGFNSPYPVANDKANIVMVFGLETPGKRYSVYLFKGFE